MSFSGEVKEELVRIDSAARHCQIAELAAILVYSGAIKEADTGEEVIDLQSDAPFIAVRCLTLLKKLFSIKEECFGNEQNPNSLYIDNSGSLTAGKILQTIKHVQGDTLVNPLVIKSLCCKRAYIRGTFLSIGSMSNPEKGYHLEFVCNDMEQANQLIDTLLIYEITAKTVARKKYQVVYIKESEEIVELLM